MKGRIFKLNYMTFSLKFECVNYIFPIPSISLTFHVPEEYWL